MADIVITKNHTLETSVLRGRLEELSKELKSSYGISSRWDGDTCKLDGTGLKSGFVKVAPNTLTIELTLGLMAKMLKSKIEDEIGKKIGKVLSA